MASRYKADLLSERTNLRTYLVSILAAIVGVALLYFSPLPFLAPVSPLLRDLGSLLVVTVTVTLLWELWGKRSFLDEIWGKANLAQELRGAGLIGFGDDFQAVPFHDMLQNATQLDLFFTYAETWRNYYKKQLEDIARTQGAHIRVVLPDPDDPKVLVELARRFNQSEDGLKERIVGAREFFFKLREKFGSTGAMIDVWYLPQAPHHTFYIIDNAVVIAMYSHCDEHELSVPTFIAEKGGTLFKFAYDQMQDMVKPIGGLARQV